MNMGCGCKRNKGLKSKTPNQNVEFSILKKRLDTCTSCRFATQKHPTANTLTKKSRCQKTNEKIGYKIRNPNQSCPIKLW